MAIKTSRLDHGSVSYTKNFLQSLKKIGVNFLLLGMGFVCTTATDVGVALPQGGELLVAMLLSQHPHQTLYKSSNRVSAPSSIGKRITLGNNQNVNYREPNSSSISLNRINPNNGRI